MKKTSQLFLILLSACVLAWFLPWIAQFAFPSASSSALVSYSPLCNRFIVSESDKEHGQTIYEIERQGKQGKKLSKTERDSLLPQIYYTVLSGKDLLPDSVCGKAISPKILKENSWVFMMNPRDVNKVAADVSLIMESMPARLELEDPTVVFRMTSDGMEFVDMATNQVLEKRSNRFTNMMKESGFAFPAIAMNANITARKPYDEGYLMVDSDHRLFHVKMQVGRPYVRRVSSADSVCVEKVFVTENPDRRFLGIVTDDKHQAYMLESSTYILHKLPFKWNPEKERMLIMANLFNWVASVKRADNTDYYAIDNQTLSLLDSYRVENKPTGYERAASYIFPFSLSLTSSNDQYVYPRIAFNGWQFIWLHAVLVLIALWHWRGSRRKAIIVGCATLIGGIYVFIPCLLFINSK